MLVEKSIQIIGGKELMGTIEVSGAKNAVLKQMILPILSEGVYKLDNVPNIACLLYTSPSPRDLSTSRMPSSA